MQTQSSPLLLLLPLLLLVNAGCDTYSMPPHRFWIAWKSTTQTSWPPSTLSSAVRTVNPRLPQFSFLRESTPAREWIWGGLTIFFFSLSLSFSLPLVQMPGESVGSWLNLRHIFMTPLQKARRRQIDSHVSRFSLEKKKTGFYQNDLGYAAF